MGRMLKLCNSLSELSKLGFLFFFGFEDVFRLAFAFSTIWHKSGCLDSFSTFLGKDYK
jgi:hypothetical protein